MLVFLIIWRDSSTIDIRFLKFDPLKVCIEYINYKFGVLNVPEPEL